MPPACHKTNLANNPADGHGNPCCTHNVTGPSTGGSPNVFIHGQPALRIGDPGGTQRLLRPEHLEQRRGQFHRVHEQHSGRAPGGCNRPLRRDRKDDYREPYGIIRVVFSS